MRVTPDDLKQLGLMVGAGLVVAAGACVVFFGASLALFASADWCGTDVVAEARSPSGAYRAVVFRRGCGATTPWGIHASVLRPRDQIDESNEVGNAVRLSPSDSYGDFPRAAHGAPELDAVWRSDTVLELRYCCGARVSHSAARVASVRVVHLELP